MVLLAADVFLVDDGFLVDDRLFADGFEGLLATLKSPNVI